MKYSPYGKSGEQHGFRNGSLAVRVANINDTDHFYNLWTNPREMGNAVGGVRVGEDIFPVPPEKQAFMVPVRHYVYRVFREDWVTK